MPPKRTKDGRPNIGLDYGLSVPKFLQPYQNMLGEASVFRNQIRKEEEEEEEQPLPAPTKQEEPKEATPHRDVARMTEKEEKRVKEIKSNKNNEMIRELAKKLASGDSQKEEKEKNSKKTATLGIGIQKKAKRSVVPEALKNQKKGMLAFDADSDSDQL